jgi:hypothetical protein
LKISEIEPSILNRDYSTSIMERVHDIDRRLAQIAAEIENPIYAATIPNLAEERVILTRERAALTVSAGKIKCS